MNSGDSFSSTTLDVMLQASLKKTLAVARERTAAQVKVDVLTRLMQCAESVRMVPNSFLRSALFGVVRNKGAKIEEGQNRAQRQYLRRKRIVSVSGVEILYTGERLDQNDLDAWTTVLHTVRKQPLGSECRTTTYALLKTMGLKDTVENRAHLIDRIVRLSASAVEIKQGRYHYIGGLIHSAVKDEVTQEWVITLDDKMAVLFGSDQFTCLDWKVRRSLKNKQLAKWLYGNYMSHTQPYPMKISTIHALCDSQTTDPYKFTQLLKTALDDVADACSRYGVTFSWEIVDGLVRVKKS